MDAREMLEKVIEWHQSQIKTLSGKENVGDAFSIISQNHSHMKALAEFDKWKRENTDDATA